MILGGLTSMQYLKSGARSESEPRRAELHKSLSDWYCMAAVRSAGTLSKQATLVSNHGGIWDS